MIRVLDLGRPRLCQSPPRRGKFDRRHGGGGAAFNFEDALARPAYGPAFCEEFVPAAAES
jgi:hypothetical protein